VEARVTKRYMSQEYTVSRVGSRVLHWLPSRIREGEETCQDLLGVSKTADRMGWNTSTIANPARRPWAWNEKTPSLWGGQPRRGGLAPSDARPAHDDAAGVRPPRNPGPCYQLPSFPAYQGTGSLACLAGPLLGWLIAVATGRQRAD
jgi:hypothetical protein